MFEVSIYGDIDPWWGISAEHVQYLIGDHEGDMSIRLFSYGGDVMEGLAIYNMIERHPGKVTVYVDSVAASIASYIAMAADEVVIADNAMLMIHNPWTEAWGESSDLKKTAGLLDTMKETLVTAYEKKTGLSRDEISAMMDEEKWMTAAEAVELGFADSVGVSVDVDEVGVSAKAAEKLFNRSTGAPAFARAKMRNAMKKIVKNEAAEEVIEDIVDEVETVAEDIEELLADVEEEDVDEATAEEVLKIVEDAGEEISLARELIAARATREQAYARVLKAVKAKSKGSVMGRNRVSASSGVDAREKFIKGASDAIIFKATGGRHGVRNEFTHMSLLDLAKESITRGGGKLSAMHDPRTIVAAAFSPKASVGITHSTTDFPNIIQTAFEVSVAREFEAMPQAFTQWTGEGSLSTFLEAKVAALGDFSNLVINHEGVEHKYGTFADRGESIQLATYGRLVGITRHAIINDVLDFFGKVPQRMAAASQRTIGQTVSAILSGNPVMSDSVALFHASHNNLKSGAGSDLTVDNLATGMAAMATQEDADGNILGIQPRYLIVSPALYLHAKMLVGMELTLNPAGYPTQVNPLAGMLEVIQDPNLGNSAAWYLAADPATYDTVEVRYLNGIKAPYIETKDGWTVDGVEFKVRIDFGAAALDYRGLYKGEGVAE